MSKNNIFFLLALCIITCSLYGMEHTSLGVVALAKSAISMCPQEHGSFGLLPNEVTCLIVSFVVGKASFEEAIQHIKVLACTNKQWKEIIASPYVTLLIINALEKKVDIVNKRYIAQLLGTAGAKEWLENNPYDATLNKDLVKAAYEGDSVKIKELLHRGADVNAKEKLSGGTIPFAPLFASIWGNNNIWTPEVLLRNGADVNAQNQDGDTALIAAVVFFSGGTLRIERLLEHGANPMIRATKSGKTALDWAHERYLREIVELLKKDFSYIKTLSKKVK